MSSRAVPRTQIRKPKPTVEQLEKAFESVEDVSPAPPLEVVAPPSAVVPKPVVQPDSEPKKKSKKLDTSSSRLKQTLYLSKEVRRALKLRAVDEECELSDLAERALRKFLKV
ncbi:MAG: hypothetical protein ACRBN8_43180 [Nannocystales bacterium]